MWIARLFAAGAVVCLAGCGGGGSSSPPAPPQPDFSLSSSTSSLTTSVGGTTGSVTVTVTSTNGFSGSVSVAITGLPAGAATNPAGPLNVSPGSPQSFTILTSDSTPTGNATVTLTGTSGSLSHLTTVVLTTTPAVSTSQSGTLLYLEAHANGHIARIGADTKWGGAIVEVSLDGINFVNAHDTGREVQPASYDGAATYTSFNCSPCIGTWGWNPVLGGDRYNHGSPVLSSQLGTTTLDVKAQPLEWNPDDKGGGASAPVTSDTTVEQFVSVVPGNPLTFKIHVTVTHTGTDQHYNAVQELPAVYVNSAYSTLSYYGGTSPWTNAPTTSVKSVPVLPGTGDLYSAEQWAAYTDGTGQGLTVYVPEQYPYVAAFSAPGSGGSGPTGDATYYFRPYTTFTFGPNSVLTLDFYLIPGDVNAARSIVYGLHQSLTAADNFTPFGNMDAPSSSSTISGANVPFSGWALDNIAVAQVQLLVDGGVVLTTALNSNRPDVVSAYPNFAPLQCGWNASFDSTKLSNGVHNFSVTITDTSGNVAVLAPIHVTVSN